MINMEIINEISQITSLDMEASASIYSFLMAHADSEEEIIQSLTLMQECIANDRELCPEDIKKYGEAPVRLLVELDRHSV